MIFEQAFEFVHFLEGGYVNHEYDRGGETKYGITKDRYPEEDIKNLTITRAMYLYKRDFWQRYNIHLLPSKYRFIAFDMYVNHNPRAAGLILQRAVNSKANKKVLKEDGKVGPLTRDAIMRYSPELFRVYAFRAKYYNEIVDNNPSQIVFLVGWMNRIFKIVKHFDAEGRLRE